MQGPTQSTTATQAGPTVLVIDDSEIARQKMQMLLTDAGLQVYALPSPIGATRAIITHKINIVVADVMMPGMRGDRLAALFRSNPRFNKMGVILVSGAAEDELQSLALEVKADATLPKSRLNELPDKIAHLWTRLQAHG